MSLATQYALKKRKSDDASCDDVGEFMGRYSKGGMVANDTPPMVDGEDNDFDDLAMRDDLESSYTGANSGDELGNGTADEPDEQKIKRLLRRGPK